MPTLVLLRHGQQVVQAGHQGWAARFGTGQERRSKISRKGRRKGAPVAEFIVRARPQSCACGQLLERRRCTEHWCDLGEIEFGDRRSEVDDTDGEQHVHRHTAEPAVVFAVTTGMKA